MVVLEMDKLGCLAERQAYLVRTTATDLMSRLEARRADDDDDDDADALEPARMMPPPDDGWAPEGCCSCDLEATEHHIACSRS